MPVASLGVMGRANPALGTDPFGVWNPFLSIGHGGRRPMERNVFDKRPEPHEKQQASWTDTRSRERKKGK